MKYLLSIIGLILIGLVGWAVVKSTDVSIAPEPPPPITSPAPQPPATPVPAPAGQQDGKGGR